MTAYYNEIDPYAAQWLRNLIAAGHIAPGDVDERSIADVDPTDLAGYTQCHFFAGIGVWSHALRLAGWPDDRPVWTGSCPCQPFSASGKGKADEDDRHLAPTWLRLIGECRPPTVFGEQVGKAIRVGWLDYVFVQMEEFDYSCGAVVLPACSVGAPHNRERIYFVADSNSGKCSESTRSAFVQREVSAKTGRAEATNGPGSYSDIFVGNGGWPTPRRWARRWQTEQGAVRGFWSHADWLDCKDGKRRSAEPGTFPLAHGVTARVGRLRAYGNAIIAQLAQAFIEAYMA